MSNPQDPRQDPLQDDEIALSRVLRALPAGEPSAKVDAAILAAATDAVAGRRQAAPTPTPSRRAVKAAGWLPTWAIGTAAAAVLAIGVGSQLRPPTAPEAAPAATTPAPVATPAAQDRMDVELIERRDEPTPTFPPPEQPGAAQAGRTQPPPPPPPPPPPAPVASPPPAEPAPFPQSLPVEEAAAAAPSQADDDTTIDTVEVTGSRVKRADIEHNRLPLTVVERNAADAERRERAQLRQAYEDQAAAAAAKAEDRFAGGALAPAAEAAPMPAPAAPPAVAARAAAPRPADLEADEAAPVVGAVAAETMADAAATADAGAGTDAAATGNVLGFSGGLPPVADDVQLPPQQWFERIRERVRRGERADALESLRLLRRDHPTLVLPADLAALR